MSNNTAKLVNEERVIELLECYGADTNNWPEDERAAANTLIKNSAELQQLQRQTRQLDDVMGTSGVRQAIEGRADARIVASLIDKLPAQEAANAIPIDKHRKQRAESRARLLNFYSLAAAFAMAFIAVTFVIQKPASVSSPQAIQTVDVAQNDLDQWMWREVFGAAEEEAEEPATFMAMVDLELMSGDDEFNDI